MSISKLTTILIVDAIEPCLPQWTAAGYSIAARVPDSGPPGFVILAGPAGELMLQTHDSLAEDLPDIAARRPSTLLYGEVASLENAKKALASAKVIVAKRTTFYGATESWLELEGGVFLALAEHTR